MASWPGGFSTNGSRRRIKQGILSTPGQEVRWYQNHQLISRQRGSLAGRPQQNGSKRRSPRRRIKLKEDPENEKADPDHKKQDPGDDGGENADAIFLSEEADMLYTELCPDAEHDPEDEQVERELGSDHPAEQNSTSTEVIDLVKDEKEDSEDGDKDPDREDDRENTSSNALAKEK